MAKFKIEIVETLSRIVEVEAADLDMAYYKVRRAYNRGDIVLNEGDFVGVDFFSPEGALDFYKED